MYNSKLYWIRFHLASAITGYISISAYASLLDITIGVTSSTIWLRICAIPAENKKYKLITEKKEAWSNSIISKI